MPACLFLGLYFDTSAFAGHTVVLFVRYTFDLACLAWDTGSYCYLSDPNDAPTAGFQSLTSPSDSPPIYCLAATWGESDASRSARLGHPLLRTGANKRVQSSDCSLNPSWAQMPDVSPLVDCCWCRDSSHL